jgi:hypothetical protein
MIEAGFVPLKSRSAMRPQWERRFRRFVSHTIQAENGMTTQAENLTVGERTEGLPDSPPDDELSRAVDESLIETFPASDPPAWHLPDEPPVNAEAKWAAARAREAQRGGCSTSVRFSR